MARGRSKTSQMTAIERKRKSLEEEEKLVHSKVRRAMEEVANAPKRRAQKRQAQIAQRHIVAITAGPRHGGRSLNTVAVRAPKMGADRPPSRRERRYALIRFLFLLGILMVFLIVLWRSLPS